MARDQAPIVGDIFFDHVAAISEADDEVAEATGPIDHRDMLEERNGGRDFLSAFAARDRQEGIGRRMRQAIEDPQFHVWP